MLAFGLDIDRLTALYRYGVLGVEPDPIAGAIVAELSGALGGMSTLIVFVDDHRLWTGAAAGPALDESAKQGSMSAAAIEMSAPLVVDDLRKDERFAGSPAVLGDPRLRCYAGAALRTPDGHAIGVLQTADTKPRLFRPGHVAMLERAAARVVEVLEAGRATRLDPATGAMLAVPFQEQAQALADHVKRHNRDLSLLILEVDPFRTVLRNFKEDLGTLVIERMGGFGRSGVRRIDSFGRLNESTFAVLLPDTTAAGAAAMALRIAEGVKDGWAMPAEDGTDVPSVGTRVATLRPGERATDFLHRVLEERRRVEPAPSIVQRKPKVA